MAQWQEPPLQPSANLSSKRYSPQGNTKSSSFLGRSPHRAQQTFHTPPPTKYGASIEHVDYTSAKRLTTTLADHSIDTLICVLKILDLKENVSYHTNLLQACQAAGLRRYILSDWSMAPPAHSRVDLLAHKAELHALGQEHMKSAGEKG